MKIWIDTDIGTDVDDALTLAHVLRHPGFELVGISTVFGDVDLRSRIAVALLEKSGVAEHRDVPVVTGLGLPISPHRKGLMFGHEGVGLIEDAKPNRRVIDEPDAESKLETLNTALEAARPDVVLAIGPLTNLGALLKSGVALPHLAIMGGKIQDVLLPGMVPDISEWNWFCDPVAAQTVIAAPHATLPRVVPAEVTFTTQLAEGDVELLGKGDTLAQVLSKLCGVWLEMQRTGMGSKDPRIALHDPLTAATLVRPGLCNFESCCIRVDEAGATTPGSGADNVEAAIDVNNDALRDHLMESWLG
jgi:purine nucleosidase